jgi:hypothetical protein
MKEYIREQYYREKKNISEFSAFVLCVVFLLVVAAVAQQYFNINFQRSVNSTE